MMGDTATYDAAMKLTYDGNLPEEREDGAWTSIYEDLRIFKIAGMKYRGNLSAYVGNFRGTLVPEPKNEYDPFAIMVKVEDGKHIGRTMGFPTANVRVPSGKALPAYGVYACWLQTAEATYPAVMNVGRHPTLPEGHVTVEAYVLDACLQLYGKKVRLSLMNFQRPERRFDDVEELKNQIAQDARDCRAYFDSLN